MIRTVQTFYSFERLQRYNVQWNWVVRELNFRYRRLFAGIRRVTGKEWSNEVKSNRCIIHFLRKLHLSAHKDLVFDTLVHLCQRHPMMKNQFGI